ncbi:SMP-30/gluconolactonase/LRE family protein [Sphingomonas sp. AP4-R1]|nr:SMP-30/gluconolactonase/LRE family protein [Sphingomonas sp. AP4-R1]
MLVTLALGVAHPALAETQPTSFASSAMPIPPAEQALPTIVADRPIVVPGAALDLEGPVYLRDGTLLFSDVQGGRVLRLDPAGQISTVTRLAGLMPGGMAIGPDGRLYVAAATASGGGSVIAMATDGTHRTTIVPERAGIAANDLVFDAHGGFYLTDARGTVGEASGGVWYVAPRAAPVPVLRHLAVANGIALSPDGKNLWVGEFALGRLYRIGLKDATTPAPFQAVTAYHFTGPAPDSMRVDAQGRVYVCLYGQGRILIFAPTGLPIGQIVLPRRDQGRNLNLTSLAIRPGTGEIAVVASDGKPGGTASIFHARIP